MSYVRINEVDTKWLIGINLLGGFVGTIAGVGIGAAVVVAFVMTFLNRGNIL